MKIQTISPARVDFSDLSAPSAPDFGDVYHSRAGALAQACHVFLGANQLPGRWAARPRFVILETGFGLGNNFLATWDAWEKDPHRCERLVFISIEKHPLLRDDLAHAHDQSPLPELAAQLLQAWPPLTANLHRLSFADSRVQLLLCLGDARHWLRELVAEVDAFYLDGFNPRQNPDMWDSYLLKALSRLAAPDATAGSWSVAPHVREGLQAAGFHVERHRGFANKGGMCVARYAPRHVLEKPAGRLALAPPGTQKALIIGAGLAGAACAWALAEQGIQSTVIERRSGPAQASSGNPGGLFHGTLNPDDGVHARFNRAAALATERLLKTLGPELPWLQQGLLRLETRLDLGGMQAQLSRLGLPSDYVQALSLAEARELSGLDLQYPAWFYPGGGALPPAGFVAALLRKSKAQTMFSVGVERLHWLDGQWQALGADGQVLAQAPLVVLAGGHEGQVLLQDLAPDLAGLLMQQRGQISHLDASSARPRLPVAGLGYAIADQGQGLWCGATNQIADTDPTLRANDHAANLAQWAELAHLQEPSRAFDPSLAQPLGRVGWRLTTPDRLPLVGGLPMARSEGRRDQPRFLPRHAGLALCMAMGSRGIGWASLCAQVLAAQVSGASVPLEASLLDAIDPARFAVRAYRQGLAQPKV